MDIAFDMCEIAHRVRVRVGLRRVIQQLIYTGAVCLTPIDVLVEPKTITKCELGIMEMKQ